MFDLISFLTQIPVRRKETKIEAVAVRSYLFPLVALLIGLPVAVVAFVSFGFLGAAPEIAALLTLLSIYLVTGLMHLDGLADFFDGIMASGDRSEKRRVMKDEKIGIAGLFATVFVILLSFFAIETVCVGLTNFFGTVIPLMVHSSSTPIRMIPPLVFAKAMSSLANLFASTPSSLNSTC